MLSGIYALLGILVGRQLIFMYNYAEMGITVLPLDFFWTLLFGLAVLVFLLTALTAYFLARRSKSPVSFKKRFNLLIPSFIGLIVVYLMIDRNHLDLVVPVSLILYGLILFNLNRFVSSKLVYFALFALILGCIALFVNGYDLLFLILGFTVFPILYGIILVRKDTNYSPSA